MRWTPNLGSFDVPNQEFALEIWDKKGTENVVADHLSQLSTPLRNEGECDLPIDDSFSDDHLFALASLGLRIW